MKNISTVILPIFYLFVLQVLTIPVIDDDARLNPEYICRQSFSQYDCNPSARFWRYDASKGICTEHSGCGSNDNKFTTSDDCLAACMGVYDGLYNENTRNDSEENIKIKAFERVDEATNDNIEI